MDGFKLDPPHSAECYLASQHRDEFIVYDGWEIRTKNGVKYKDGRGNWWHRFRCNCIDCDARLLVRSDRLMVMLAGGLHAE